VFKKSHVTKGLLVGLPFAVKEVSLRPSSFPFLPVPEKPIGKAIILCDQVIEDRETRKKTLVGIFTRLAASKAPIVHPAMSMYVALTNGHGIIPVKVLLKDAHSEDNREFFKVEGQVNFEHPNKIIEMVFNLRNLTFPKFSQYCFEVHANEEFIFESKLDVVQFKPPVNPNPPPNP
jgi:hypothetical protein